MRASLGSRARGRKEASDRGGPKGRIARVRRGTAAPRPRLGPSRPARARRRAETRSPAATLMDRAARRRHDRWSGQQTGRKACLRRSGRWCRHGRRAAEAERRALCRMSGRGQGTPVEDDSPASGRGLPRRATASVPSRQDPPFARDVFCRSGWAGSKPGRHAGRAARAASSSGRRCGGGVGAA